MAIGYPEYGKLELGIGVPKQELGNEFKQVQTMSATKYVMVFGREMFSDGE